jgi:hypothetical protein
MKLDQAIADAHQAEKDLARAHEEAHMAAMAWCTTMAKLARSQSPQPNRHTRRAAKHRKQPPR